MEYVCVDARFFIWNGKRGYTVEFCYGISTWFVFENRNDVGAVFNKKIVPGRSKTPTRDLAEDILQEYFDSLKIKQCQTK